MRACKVVTALAPLLMTAAPIVAQQKPTAAPRLQIEITGGIGTTVVNIDTWSHRTLDDRRTLNHWGAGRVLIPIGDGLKIGVEAGYHHHFWYHTPILYVHTAAMHAPALARAPLASYSTAGDDSPVHDYTVTAMHVAALVRVPLAPRLTADVGGAMHFFNNAGTHVGALAALTYHIPIGRSLVLPIGVRADAIIPSPIMIPIVLNAGVGFSL